MGYNALVAPDIRLAVYLKGCFPRTRRDLVDSAVIVECMFAGRLENLTPPHNPLDVLAQQTVAAAAMDALQVDEWYSRVRRAAPWKDLPRRVLTPRWICFPGAIPLAIFCFSPQTGLEQGDRDIDRPTRRSIVGGYQRRHHSGSWHV